jgi:hypothetical protein
MKSPAFFGVWEASYFLEHRRTLKDFKLFLIATMNNSGPFTSVVEGLGC